jgi:hypothetical protein
MAEPDMQVEEKSRKGRIQEKVASQARSGKGGAGKVILPGGKKLPGFLQELNDRPGETRCIGTLGNNNSERKKSDSGIKFLSPRRGSIPVMIETSPFRKQSCWDCGVVRSTVILKAIGADYLTMSVNPDVRTKSY